MLTNQMADSANGKLISGFNKRKESQILLWRRKGLDVLTSIKIGQNRKVIGFRNKN